MKSLLLVTASLAAFAAAPALAQDGPVGSVGVSLSHSEIAGSGFDAEGEAALVDVAVAIPVTSAWTVTVDGGYAFGLNGNASEDNAFNGRVHASTLVGGVRVGGFVGGTDVADEQLWSFGAEAQAYMDKMTLTGSLAYETFEGVDADIWTLGGDAAYFVRPNVRLNAGLAWTTLEAGGLDTDGWQANVGGEYRFEGTGLGLTAGYSHAELNDFDVDIDTVSVGLRVSFGGGDLQSRNRAGADLGRTAAGLSGLAGAF